MRNAISHYASRSVQWGVAHANALFFLVVVHTMFGWILELPYFNIATAWISPLPFIVDTIVILYLFRPEKETFLKLAIAVFIASIPPAILHIERLVERLGEVVFFLLAFYMLASINEFRKSHV